MPDILSNNIDPVRVEVEYLFASCKYPIKRYTHFFVLIQMIASGWTKKTIASKFSDANLTDSAFRFCRKKIKELPEKTLKKLIELQIPAIQTANPIVPATQVVVEAGEQPVEQKEFSAVQVLKKTIASVATRIEAIEKDIKDGKLALDGKTEDRLLKYYDKIVSLRIQLQSEQVDSEVSQAYKQAAVDMCMLAMEYITDESSRTKFLEKVRSHERAHH